MANAQNVAIWIILVVVLAAAAAVIVIAVQNSKREQQLGTVQDAAALYQKVIPTPSSVSRPAMGRPSQRMNTNRVFVPRQGARFGTCLVPWGPEGPHRSAAERD